MWQELTRVKKLLRVTGVWRNETGSAWKQHPKVTGVGKAGSRARGLYPETVRRQGATVTKITYCLETVASIMNSLLVAKSI